ncbi:MAG TPA: hypothetical protein VG253_20625, partial [Streptosporangiaceae bacterium]|nr:hypothetical protein [Streptosporangiaceae bacterium]
MPDLAIEDVLAAGIRRALHALGHDVPAWGEPGGDTVPDPRWTVPARPTDASESEPTSPASAHRAMVEGEEELAAARSGEGDLAAGDSLAGDSGAGDTGGGDSGAVDSGAGGLDLLGD